MHLLAAGSLGSKEAKGQLTMRQVFIGDMSCPAPELFTTYATLAHCWENSSLPLGTNTQVAFWLQVVALLERGAQAKFCMETEGSEDRHCRLLIQPYCEAGREIM